MYQVSRPAAPQMRGASDLGTWSKKAVYEILLVTSRRSRQWIIPKGWPIRGLEPFRSAAQEAYEEAGVRGKVSSRPIGSYVYDKFLDAKTINVPCETMVFKLRVEFQERGIGPSMDSERFAGSA
jgi:8-oxo-dGTP pyrophosphatase MutT (NUDIX family)